jgi:hypothetical protein
MILQKETGICNGTSADGQLSSLLSSFFWKLRSGGEGMFEILKDIILREIESVVFQYYSARLCLSVLLQKN